MMTLVRSQTHIIVHSENHSGSYLHGAHPAMISAESLLPPNVELIIRRFFVASRTYQHTRNIYTHTHTHTYAERERERERERIFQLTSPYESTSL